jgi:hypothetical protein
MRRRRGADRARIPKTAAIANNGNNRSNIAIMGDGGGDVNAMFPPKT